VIQHVQFDKVDVDTLEIILKTAVNIQKKIEPLFADENFRKRIIIEIQNKNQVA